MRTLLLALLVTSGCALDVNGLAPPRAVELDGGIPITVSPPPPPESTSDAAPPPAPPTLTIDASPPETTIEAGPVCAADSCSSEGQCFVSALTTCGMGTVCDDCTTYGAFCDDGGHCSIDPRDNPPAWWCAIPNNRC